MKKVILAVVIGSAVWFTTILIVSGGNYAAMISESVGFSIITEFATVVAIYFLVVCRFKMYPTDFVCCNCWRSYTKWFEYGKPARRGVCPRCGAGHD